MFKLSIPEISKEELRNRYNRIKPVITQNGKLHYLREYSLEELTDISYFWTRYEDIAEEVKADELVPLKGKDFVCLHGYGYPFFQANYSRGSFPN